jgi:branched-chain amino acid transport system substrate-binding protein
VHRIRPTSAAASIAALASDEFPAIGGRTVEGTFMTFPRDPRNRADAASGVQEFKARDFNLET